MTVLPSRKFNIDEFLASMMDQDGRQELRDGRIHELARPQTAGHVLTKFAAANELGRALKALGPAGELFPDGFAVKIDEFNLFLPDAMLRFGEPLDGDDYFARDPVIVIEISTPVSLPSDLTI